MTLTQKLIQIPKLDLDLRLVSEAGNILSPLTFGVLRSLTNRENKKVAGAFSTAFSAQNQLWPFGEVGLYAIKNVLIEHGVELSEIYPEILIENFHLGPHICDARGASERDCAYGLMVCKTYITVAPHMEPVRKYLGVSPMIKDMAERLSAIGEAQK